VALLAPLAGSLLVMRQRRGAHDSLARGRSQGTPQAPQFVSVVREVSQPLVKMPSQSPQFGSQFGTHWADRQVEVAACGSGPQMSPSSVAASQSWSIPSQISDWPG
jgi:hypothetical protein